MARQFQSSSGPKSPSRGSARGNSMNRSGPGQRTAQGTQSGSGGGAKSRPVAVRTGEAASGINPGAVSYLGSKLGAHATELGDFPLKSTPWATKAPAGGAQKLGNEVALDIGRGGPGTGRVMHRAGSQSPSPSATPMTPPEGGGPGSFGFKGGK